MENSKAKNIIIVILIILLLGCLGIFIWQYVKTTDSINNNYSESATNVGGNIQNNQQITDDKQEENTNLPQEDNEVEDNENKQDQITNQLEDANKVDPYANYKDYTWGRTKVESPIGSSIEIKNGKVYLTYKDYETEKTKTEQVKNIKGTPKKAVHIINGGAAMFYILTDEGQVYAMEASGVEAWLNTDLSKHNVIDLTSGRGRGIVVREAYYLTAEGKLIDRNGDTFEELNMNFVDFFGYVYSMVYIDNNNNVYFSKNNDANYVTVKDSNGNKIKAKKMYIDNSFGGDTVVIITEDNQMVYVGLGTEGNIWQEKGKIKSYNVYNDYEGSPIMLVLMDNDKYIIKGNIDYSYYDVENKESVSIEETQLAIESVKLYKRKENTEDEYYLKSMPLSKEQIGRVREFLSEFGYEKNISSYSEKDVRFKAVIKFKNGTELTIKTTAQRAICDNIQYSLSDDQSIEIFDTISWKYDWN